MSGIIEAEVGGGGHGGVEGWPAPARAGVFVEDGDVGIADQQLARGRAVLCGELVEKRQEADSAVASTREPDDVEAVVARDLPEGVGALLI